MSKLVEFVRAFVKEKHSKQKRWNGDPYFSHLEATEEIAVRLVTEKYLGEIARKDIIKIRIISLSHDICEDVDEFLNKEYEVVAIYRKADVDKELTEEDWVDITDALKRLNKSRSKDYLAFVLSARGSVWSEFPKRGDLTHNSSDLKHGNMRDKYLMALYILENT